MFPARIADISAADIDNLFEIEAAESIDLEFKRELHGDGDKPDPWMTAGKIGDRAKDELAVEIGAFANTTGGTLIVGIDEEPQTKVARKPLRPIPNCKQAAAILHQSLSARIEPRLPVFECEGVVTEKDGTSGVVVMRVLESYLAPHRNTRDGQCYVRRHDRAEPMSMLEIQEMTRRIARGGEVIDSTFRDRADKFFEWLPGIHQRTEPRRGLLGNQQYGAQPEYKGGWAARFTAIPMRPLSLGNVATQPWLKEIKLEVFDGGGSQGQLRPYEIERTGPWLPRLRAVERAFQGDSLIAVDRISADGGVERFARSIFVDNGMRPKFLNLAVDQFMWHAASVIRMADMIRTLGDRPTQNYAFEIELMNSDQMNLIPYPGVVPPGLQKLPEGRVVFPRYEIGESEDFNGVLTAIDTDFWNAAGNRPNWEIAINWPPARA